MSYMSLLPHYQHDTLAKNLVICFRLNFTKDHTTNAIAGEYASA